MSVQYLNTGVCVFQVDKILKVIPRDRRTFLFSATMTKKVQRHRLCFTVSSFSAACSHFQNFVSFPPKLCTQNWFSVFQTHRLCLKQWFSVFQTHRLCLKQWFSVFQTHRLCLKQRLSVFQTHRLCLKQRLSVFQTHRLCLKQRLSVFQTHRLCLKQ